jgi:4-amino-4-deoxy-L-arabinose transferase-like glycosyltransferase
MTLEPEDARPPDRAARALFVVLAALLAASLPFLVHGFYEVDDETNDASMYILCAQALQRGEGYAYLGQPFIIRPPALSALLVPILATRGLDYGAMHALVAACGAAGVLLLYLWTLPRLGAWVSFALALCLWLNPGYRHFSNQVMTDVPGVAVLLAVLVLERWADRRSSWRRDALLGLLVGLGTYVRTAIGLLLPAILLARSLAHARAGSEPRAWRAFLARRFVALVLACGLAVLPWSVRNARVAPPPPADQNFIYSYATGILHADAGDPDSPPRPLAEILGVVPARAWTIVRLFGERIEGRSIGALRWLVAAWLVGSVLFLVLRRRQSAELVFLGLGLVLVTYFGFRARLVLPMYVLALAAAAETGTAVLARGLGRRRARALVAVGLAAWAAFDFRPPRGWKAEREAFEREERQAQAFAAVLPSDARLAARVGWHYSLLLQRPVYSLRFAMDRSRSVAGLEGVLDKYGLDTVLVGPEPIEGLLLPYLRSRYGPGLRAGGGWVFRVRDRR